MKGELMMEQESERLKNLTLEEKMERS